VAEGQRDGEMDIPRGRQLKVSYRLHPLLKRT
jgi:hypothetical protein